MEKWILFDLDGTLLPMDQEVFTKAYFKELAKKLAPYGYDPEVLVNAIWSGTADMVKNNGQNTNKTVFWDRFFKIFGEGAKNHLSVIDEFYRINFDNIKNFCGYNPEAKKTVDVLKKNGYKVGLATNPIFPLTATELRIKWAGFTPEDFKFYTTYENSYYCKPNTDYYKSILEKYGISPENCIMVGNDVCEDMVAEKLGIKVFLLTDCIINKEGKDISVYPHGSFSDLLKFLKIEK